MTLRILTASGALDLGDPPTGGPQCDRCPAPAQLVVRRPFGQTAVCASCAADLITADAPRRLPTSRCPACGRDLNLYGQR